MKLTPLQLTWIFIAPFALETQSARAQSVEQEIERLIAPNGSAFDRFGYSVALHGERVAVGAHLAPSVYVFVQGPSGFSLEAEPVPSAPKHTFGIAVDLSADHLLVGDDTADAPNMQLVGAAYMFARSGTAWVEEVVLRPEDGGIHDHFGEAVAMEGDVAVVGAPEHIHGSSYWGAAYVYRRTPFGWVQEQELDAPANAVALEGELIACGWNGASYVEGHVFLYAYDGSHWVQQQALVASDATDGDSFGRALALSGDTLVVGANNALHHGLPTGAVYVFERGATGWTERQKLLATDADAGDFFGISVAFDGATLLAGAIGEAAGGMSAGATYRFARGPAGFVQVAKLVASDASPNSFLGRGIDVEDSVAVVGATGADGLAVDSGAAYVYDLAPGNAYCFGDGSGTPCPCGNSGASDEGCANSTGAGATLASSGSGSAALDDLVFTAANLIPAQPAMLFVGLNAPGGGAGVPFGDGLRCAGGDTVRLGIRLPDAAGGASWGPELGSMGGWGAGDLRRFQVHYRDPLGSPCGSGFNLSNGFEIVFGP